MECIPGEQVEVEVTQLLGPAYTGSRLQVYTGHTGTVRPPLVFNSTTLLTYGDDMTVRLWDIASGTPLVVLNTGHTDSIRGAGLFTIGSSKFLFTVGADSVIMRWNTATWVNDVSYSTGSTTCFYPTVYRSSQLIVGCSDGSVKNFNVTTGALVVSYQGHPGEVRQVAVLNDLLFTTGGYSDFRLVVFDLLKSSPQVVASPRDTCGTAFTAAICRRASLSRRIS